MQTFNIHELLNFQPLYNQLLTDHHLKKKFPQPNSDDLGRLDNINYLIFNHFNMYEAKNYVYIFYFSRGFELLEVGTYLELLVPLLLLLLLLPELLVLPLLMLEAPLSLSLHPEGLFFHHSLSTPPFTDPSEADGLGETFEQPLAEDSFFFLFLLLLFLFLDPKEKEGNTILR